MEEIRPKKEKIRLSFLQIFILLELVIITISVIVLYQAGYNASKPEKVVEVFCNALKDREWNTVYSYLNIPEDDTQLTRQMFIDAKYRDVKKGKYSSYSYEESEEDVKLCNFEKWYGEKPEKKYYMTTFQKSDGSGEVQLGVNLVKTGNKHFLFFDEWKVSPKNYLVANTGFTLQKGAKMKVNGLEIPLDQYREGNWVSFGIPYLFKGSYQIEVSMDGMLTYRNEILLRKSGENYMVQLSVDTNGTEELLEKAKEDVNEIVNAVLTDKSFGIISDLFTSEELGDGSIVNAYNEARAMGSNGGLGITWLEITNLKGTVQVNKQSYELNSQGDIEVVIEGNAKEKYIDVDEHTQMLVNKEKEFPIQFVAIYAKTNDKWKLVNMPVTAELFQ